MIGGTRGTVGGTWQENGLAFSNQKGGHLSYRTLDIYGHVTKKMEKPIVPPTVSMRRYWMPRCRRVPKLRESSVPRK